MDRIIESKFGNWTTPESPVDIEYSLVVIDEIRQSVTEGFQRLSRGGIEVGGVLYGTVEGRTLRISAVRQIACEHALGPTFHLSENDRALLTAQLERDREDPRLESMTPVGWYLSHTRSEITLQKADLETYDFFFPAPWQVTLVVRPGRAGTMRAGFFVRESNGDLKTDRSYLDFMFPDRLASVLDRPPRERPAQAPREVLDHPPERRRPERFDPRTEAEDLAPFAEIPYRKPAVLEQQYAPYPDQHRRVPWVPIGVVLVFAILAVLGLRYFQTRVSAEPISLALSEREGQLQIHWNGASNTITAATGGSLEITDGPDKQRLVLTPKELAQGSAIYTRKSGDVQIRMVVNGSAGQTEEGARFVGKAAAEAVDGKELDLLKSQRDALQDEVTRLREENGQQTERIQQLERTLTVMRTRMGISQSGR